MTAAMVDTLDQAVIQGLAKEINRLSAEPLHDQISALLRERIVAGQWPPHTRLPSEPDLARLLGVARGTVRRAIQTLTHHGLLVQHQGRGTFVGGKMLEQTFAQEIISTAEALDRDGVSYDTHVIRRAVELATPDVNARLQLHDRNAQVVALRRIRSVEQTPVFLLDNFVVASKCPGLESRDFSELSLFSILAHEYGLHVSAVRRTFQAIGAPDDVASLLQIKSGSPVLYLEQTSFEGDTTPIEYSDVWIRGDKLRLSSWLHR